MEDKVAILETTIPLRSIPDIQDILEDVLCSVINDLLSLKGDSAKKLYQSVPAIKKHCWSMGLKEVVKMFTMYADGELSIQPRSNYFDRVLVGQIFNDYKTRKPVKKSDIKEKKISQEDKDKWAFLGTVNCYDAFIQTGDIINGYVWVYNHLDKLNIINYSLKDKFAQMPIAREQLIQDNKQELSRDDYKTFVRDLENKRKSQAVINKAKKMLLDHFFTGLQGKHIKDLL